MRDRPAARRIRYCDIDRPAAGAPTTEPTSERRVSDDVWECAHGHQWRMESADTPRRCPVCGTITFAAAGVSE